VVVPVVGAAAAVINTGRYVLDAEAVQSEDAYVAADSATIEGRIEGDLVIATGSLDISGTVTGDVLVAARGRVDVSGTIQGSLRGIARSVDVTGTVGDDVAVAALDLTIDGIVQRDLIGFGATAKVAGSVGRDLLGRFFNLVVRGDVGRDVDVTVRDVTLESGAALGGDLVYQADRDAAVESGAVVSGQVIQIPTAAPFAVRVVLDLALILGFLGYLVGGVGLLWLVRGAAALAVAVVAARPALTLGVGLGVAIGGPIAIAVLVATLVGIPLALVGVLLLLALLLFGTVPVVAAVGVRLLRGRGGVYGGFLAAAVVWRIAALFVPLLGAVLFLLALVWGTGGWVVGAWRARTAAAPVST
jgi:cytoskeletal protein CcmA (bactofilin family)